MQKAFLDLSLYAFMPKSLCNSRQISYQRISDKALAGCWIVMLPIRGIGIVRYCILLNSYEYIDIWKDIIQVLNDLFSVQCLNCNNLFLE